ncbi:MAG: nitroreductase family protein [Defluviitaleaceae bacterium]|nr:nitroreductase family protein [Defluviitaleaceae bacterium]
MNEVLKAIAERNSCRDFSPEPLTKEQIEILVKAALAAPSAMNLQPWYITVVTDKSFIEAFDAEIMEFVKKDENWYKTMQERGGKALYDAPCMIFIAKNETNYATHDCGIVSQNIALAAHAMGLGNVICGMARIPFEGAKGAEFTKQLQFPEGYTFGMSVLVGKANKGKTPHELDFNKVSYV